jgi:hypothetical protein
MFAPARETRPARIGVLDDARQRSKRDDEVRAREEEWMTGAFTVSAERQGEEQLGV